MKPLDEINQYLMDGLEFCRKAYALFETIRCGPNGVEKLRLRKGRAEKKLVEEIIPIARYVQTRYGPERTIKVRWVDGNQSYDACLVSSGYLTDKLIVPKEQYVEATTAVHHNDHFSREHLHKKGFVFGDKGISRDRRTRKVLSDPVVYTNWEAPDDFSKLVIQRIKEKTGIDYPSNTVLVIQCMLNTLFLDDEWAFLIEKVRGEQIKHSFDEIFLFDSGLKHFTVL